MIDVYASGAILSRYMVVEAMVQAYVELGRDRGWKWKCSRQQLAVANREGFTLMTLLMREGDPDRDMGLGSGRPADVTLIGIPAEECETVPEDQIELWDGDKKLAVVRDLATLVPDYQIR